MKAYYHVSPKDHGKTVTFIPRVPRSAAKDEGTKTRVCFCPTVLQCLVAMHGVGNLGWSFMVDEMLGCQFADKGKVTNPAIYYVTKKLYAPPRSRSDFRLTEEHWSLIPIEVRRIGFIDVRACMLLTQVPAELPITSRKQSNLTKWELAMYLAATRSSQHLLLKGSKWARTKGAMT